MVVTIIYRPSDVEAAKLLNQIKAKLGISGKIDTPEERTKAYLYLKSRGMNMSMLACNPDVFSLTGNMAEDKALCMLYNEMQAYGMQESIKGNEEQLRKYGSAFKSTYERNKKVFDVEYNAIKAELQKNTGVKMIPVPKPVLAPETIKRIEQEKQFFLHPAPNPTVPGFKIKEGTSHHTPTSKIHTTMVSATTVPQGPKPKGIDVKKVGLGLLGLAVLYFLMRRR